MPGVGPVAEYLFYILPTLPLIPELFWQVLEAAFEVVFVFDRIHYRIEESSNEDEYGGDHDFLFPNNCQPSNPPTNKMPPVTIIPTAP
jgi:hypothetical protein